MTTGALERTRGWTGAWTGTWTGGWRSGEPGSTAAPWSADGAAAPDESAPDVSPDDEVPDDEVPDDEVPGDARALPGSDLAAINEKTPATAAAPTATPRVSPRTRSRPWSRSLLVVIALHDAVPA